MPYVIQVVGPADNFSSQLYIKDLWVASLPMVWELELNDLWGAFQPKPFYDSMSSAVLTDVGLTYTQPGFTIWLNEVKAYKRGYRRETEKDQETERRWITFLSSYRRGRHSYDPIRLVAWMVISLRYTRDNQTHFRSWETKIFHMLAFWSVFF